MGHLSPRGNTPSIYIPELAYLSFKRPHIPRELAFFLSFFLQTEGGSTVPSENFIIILS